MDCVGNIRNTKNAISRPRNPLIARLFSRARLAENAGFGFHKMLVYKVVFETYVGYSEVTLYLDKVIKDKNIPENLQNSIIKIFRNNKEIYMLEISKILNVNHETIKRDFQVLKSKETIIHDGPGKSRKWIINDTEKTI